MLISIFDKISKRFDNFVCTNLGISRLTVARLYQYIHSWKGLEHPYLATVLSQNVQSRKKCKLYSNESLDKY